MFPWSEKPPRAAPTLPVPKPRRIRRLQLARHWTRRIHHLADRYRSFELPAMNFSALRLFLLASILVVGQVCCCQAWLVLGIITAKAESAPVVVKTAGCCGTARHAQKTADSPAPEAPAAPVPCDNHDDCGGCLPRLGWLPQPPAAPPLDTLGDDLPQVIFADPVPLDVQAHLAGCLACANGCCSPPVLTLLSLHCALNV